MVEYLEQLVANKEYRKALTYAEQMLLGRDRTVQEILAINCAMLKARVELGEHHGALVSGELAVKLARDMEEWEYFGTASFLMGAVSLILRQPEKALTSCLEYLEKFPCYTTAAKYECFALFNMGLAYLALGDLQQALRAEYRALDTAQMAEDQRVIHGVRHGLISLYMRAGNLQPIPALLAKCAHYLRNNPETTEWRDSWLWHSMLRTEFAIVTNRMDRARAVAFRGLRMAHNAPLQRFHLHMLLAQIARRHGDPKEAITQSLAARVCAMTCRRYDLESEAADFLYSVTKMDPNAMVEIGQLSLGEVLDFATVFPGN